MFTRKQLYFKTEAEAQSYIDKKITSTVDSRFAAERRAWNQFSKEQNTVIQKLNERIVHLEKFLGVEFRTETTTGYKKVKKTKKK